MAAIIIVAKMPIDEEREAGQPEARRLLHVERIPIRWGDMDAMGHVNNTLYFRFMEQARIGWFESLLPPGEAWQTTGIVIVNASCNFRRAIGYPGTVEVRVYAGQPGRSSLATYYELLVDADPEPYADGAAVVVFVDMQEQKPIRIPESLRKRLR
jgi:acyl-CoA thioester hydrolase